MGRILIVEDETALAELLAWVLAQEGHKVMVANSATEGIERGLAEPPDLLITDWMLRDILHGGEVAECIRGYSPATRAIVITGHPEIVAQADAWSDYIDVLIEKPFHMRHLLVAVRRLLPQQQRIQAQSVSS